MGQHRSGIRAALAYYALVEERVVLEQRRLLDGRLIEFHQVGPSDQIFANQLGLQHAYVFSSFHNGLTELLLKDVLRRSVVHIRLRIDLFHGSDDRVEFLSLLVLATEKVRGCFSHIDGSHYLRFFAFVGRVDLASSLAPILVLVDIIPLEQELPKVFSGRVWLKLFEHRVQVSVILLNGVVGVNSHVDFHFVVVASHEVQHFVFHLLILLGGGVLEGGFVLFQFSEEHVFFLLLMLLQSERLLLRVDFVEDQFVVHFAVVDVARVRKPDVRVFIHQELSLHLQYLDLPHLLQIVAHLQTLPLHKVRLPPSL